MTGSLRSKQGHGDGRPHRHGIRVKEDILDKTDDASSLSTLEISRELV